LFQLLMLRSDKKRIEITIQFLKQENETSRTV